MRSRRSREQSFTRFVKETEPRLSYRAGRRLRAGGRSGGHRRCPGPRMGTLAKGRTDDQSRRIPVPGRSKASRRYRRPRVLFPKVTDDRVFEPELTGALGDLTRNQRVAVGFVHAHTRTAPVPDRAVPTDLRENECTARRWRRPVPGGGDHYRRLRQSVPERFRDRRNERGHEDRYGRVPPAVLVAGRSTPASSSPAVRPGSTS